MAALRAVVVVIDGLGASWLGPYGNTWLGTPAFDRLASQSVLCETAIADSGELAAAYRGFWTGRHVAQAELPISSGAHSLPSLAGIGGRKNSAFDR